MYSPKQLYSENEKVASDFYDYISKGYFNLTITQLFNLEHVHFTVAPDMLVAWAMEIIGLAASNKGF